MGKTTTKAAELSYREGTRVRSTAQYNEHLEQLATDAYARHVVVAYEHDRVGLRRRTEDGKYSGFYATEIVMLGYGRAIIHGDVFPVLVRGGPSDLSEFLEWFGTSHVDYIASKVEHPKASFNDEVFAYDMLTHLQQRIEDGYEVDLGQVRAILDAVESSDLEYARELFRDTESDAWESLASMGKVADAALFYTREACRTAMRLLEGVELVPIDEEVRIEPCAHEQTGARVWVASINERDSTGKPTPQEALADLIARSRA